MDHVLYKTVTLFRCIAKGVKVAVPEGKVI